MNAKQGLLLLLALTIAVAVSYPHSHTIWMWVDHRLEILGGAAILLIIATVFLKGANRYGAIAAVLVITAPVLVRLDGVFYSSTADVCQRIPNVYRMRLGQKEVINPNACQIRWDISGGCIRAESRMGAALAEHVCNKEDAQGVPSGLFAIVVTSGTPSVEVTECPPFAKGKNLERCD